MHTQLSTIGNVKLPTITACGALLIWAMYALLISEILTTLPKFETIFFMFGINFMAIAIRFTIKKQWSTLKQPPFVWLIGVLGTCGSDFAYITAMKYAPPAHVDLIDYLWPFLLIVFTGFLPKERFTLQHLLGGAIALLGVLFLLTGSAGEETIGFKWEYMPGYCCALTAACIWCLYTLFSRWYQKMPPEMGGMYYGVGAIIAFGLHTQHELFVMPSWYEASLLLVLGIAAGMANLLWIYGTRKGNVKLLGVLAYCTPMLSMTLLVCFGKEAPSLTLLIACLLFVSGILIGTLNWKRIYVRLSLYIPLT